MAALPPASADSPPTRLFLKATRATDELAFTNSVYLHPDDAQLLLSPDANGVLPMGRNHLQIRDFVFLFISNPAVLNITRGQIGLSEPQRNLLGIALGDMVPCSPYVPPSTQDEILLQKVVLQVDSRLANPKVKVFKHEPLLSVFMQVFNGQFLSIDQTPVMAVPDARLKLRVLELQVGGKNGSRGLVVPGTEVCFRANPKGQISIVDTPASSGPDDTSSDTGLLPSGPIDPMSWGLGGVNREFFDIIRDALISRTFKSSLIVDGLGHQHIKGIMLYGPPGTGKSLMASVIAKMLNTHPPIMKTGPEFFDKFYGEAERKIRELFVPAEKEYKEKGNDSSLHIIVIDEIDAICKTRGSRGDSGVSDNIVNQLLAKIEGTESLPNILLIGMTNRIDMIDPAILRPGRFEIHIEVGLPDEVGRLQIFRIHTNKMVKNGFLAPDVDLAELARSSKNFTGADIRGVVKRAVNYSLMSHVGDLTDTKRHSSAEGVVINRSHMLRALEDCRAQAIFAVSDKELAHCLKNQFIPFGPRNAHVMETLNTCVNQLKNVHSLTPLSSVLLYGKAGTGKTALAAKIAQESGTPYVSLLTAEDLLNYGTEQARTKVIIDAFENAYKCERSIVILDDIERILDYTPIGPRFSNSILQTILVLLRKQPRKTGRNLLIIGTTRNIQLLRDLEISDEFNMSLEVPSVKGEQEMKVVLSNLFQSVKLPLSSVETLAKVFGNGELPIKRVFTLFEFAMQNKDPIATLAESLQSFS